MSRTAMQTIQTKLATDASAIESRAIRAILKAPVCTANVLLFLVCSFCAVKPYSRALFAGPIRGPYSRALFAPGAALEMTHERVAVAAAKGERPAVEHQVKKLVLLSCGEGDDKQLTMQFLGEAHAHVAVGEA